METLRLINRDDEPAILKIIQDTLPDYESRVEIDLECDTDHYRVEVFIKVPSDKYEMVYPTLKKLEDSITIEYGEAYWTWYTLCSQCENFSEAHFPLTKEYFPLPKCIECLCNEWQEERGLEECRICGKKFNRDKDTSFRTKFEIEVSDNSKQVDLSFQEQELNEDWDAVESKKENKRRDNSFIYEIGFSIHTTPMEKWECCSLECAKKSYVSFLKRLLKHPFTKECLDSDGVL